MVRLTHYFAINCSRFLNLGIFTDNKIFLDVINKTNFHHIQGFQDAPAFMNYYCIKYYA